MPRAAALGYCRLTRCVYLIRCRAQCSAPRPADNSPRTPVVGAAAAAGDVAAGHERGCAIIGIFHDHAAREAVCDREIDVSQFAAA